MQKARMKSGTDIKERPARGYIMFIAFGTTSVSHGQ